MVGEVVWFFNLYLIYSSPGTENREQGRNEESDGEEGSGRRRSCA